MAYSIIGQCSGATNTGAGTTATTSGTYTVTAGNCLVAVIGYQTAGGANAVVSIIDNVGANDSWTRVATGAYDSGSTMGIEIYYIANAAASAATTFTLTLTSNSVTPQIGVVEISGLDTTAPLVGNSFLFNSAIGTGTDAGSSGATGTLTAQPDAILGFLMSTSGSITITEGTGYTGLTQFIDWGSGPSCKPEHKRVTSTSAVTATFTVNIGGQNFMGGVVALKEPSGAAPPLLGQACL